MPRRAKTVLFPVAVSPARAAEVLDIRPEQIQEAIRSGALPVHVIGIKKRILVENLVAWVKRWPNNKSKG